jgi:FAD/FMN-containing dehydrogenase
VVYPKNAHEAARLAEFAAKFKPDYLELSLTCRAAGTDMSGGPLNDSVIVDVLNFKSIGAVENSTVVAEPGVFYKDFETVLAAKGFLLPSYPASKNLCTIGGMVANNSGGEKSLSYGKTVDYVLEVGAVLADGKEHILGPITAEELERKKLKNDFEGEVYKKIHKLIEDNRDLIKSKRPTVSKNSAGYNIWDVWDGKTFDLSKLFVGSQGTLGIITKVKFRLAKIKSHSSLLVIFLKDMKQLGMIVNAVKAHSPESFESFDDNTLKLAVRFLPDLIKKMKGNAFKLAWQFLPEIWMTTTFGAPKLVLIAEFSADNEADCQSQALLVKKEVESRFDLKARVSASPQEVQKYWTIRRESFSLLRQHVSGRVTAPFIEDIIVHPLDLPEFLPKLDSLLHRYPKLIYTIAGHAGDGNFHIIPLMNLKDPSERAIIPELSNDVYDLVAKFKGSITAEHNDGLVRTPYLEKMFGKEMINLFTEVKQIFDPQGLFNPCKKVGGSVGYSLSRIKF